MDVIKKKDKSALGLHSTFKVVLVGLVVITGILYFFTNNEPDVVGTDILIGKVGHGELLVTVDGFGILESDKHLLLTARSQAIVKEVLLKPGAKVTKDSEIVRLENPELDQELFEAEQALELAKSELSRKSASQERDLLLESGQLTELISQYEIAKLKRMALRELNDKKIVSDFEYRTSELLEEQLMQRVKLVQDRVAKLKPLHAQSIKADKKQVELAGAKLTLIRQKVDRLVVRAGMDGVLQRMPVNLGQSLAVGQEIALIGSATDLKALLQVSQSQAQQVAMGQQVEIDTRKDKIAGVVVRISPIVQNNTVTVEVELRNALPASARPQLNVDGTIFVERVSNAYFIERPANAREESSLYLFKLHEDGSSATREQVTLGKLAGNYIQITSEVEEGARYVISGVPEFMNDKERIEIQ